MTTSRNCKIIEIEVPGRNRTGPRDPEGPGTKKSRDLKSPKVLGLENGKVPEKMTLLACS